VFEECARAGQLGFIRSGLSAHGRSRVPFTIRKTHPPNEQTMGVFFLVDSVPLNDFVLENETKQMLEREVGIFCISRCTPQRQSSWFRPTLTQSVTKTSTRCTNKENLLTPPSHRQACWNTSSAFFFWRAHEKTNRSHSPISLVIIFVLPVTQLPTWWQRFKGERDDSLPWQRDTSASVYITELLKAHQKEIQCEVGSLTVIEMKNALQKDESETYTSRTLVIPSGTRGAWQAVLGAVRDDSTDQRFFVIGTSGVGKSRTLNYLIREIILSHQNKAAKPPAIIFEHRKDEIVWLFVPKNPALPASTWEAYSMAIGDFRASGTALLYNPRNFYIVDSGLPEKPHMVTNVAATTLFVCSPDTHCSDFQKYTSTCPIYLPCWEKQEIIAAVPYVLGEERKREILGSAGPNELVSILKAHRYRWSHPSACVQSPR